MSQRTVFKIFGSLGPGGSVITLLEKLCKVVFPDAYELGDPNEMKLVEEGQIKQARQDFVNGLFDFRSEFERTQTSLDEATQQEGKDQLDEMLRSAIRNISRLEKSKLARMRVFYQREENDAKYQQAIEAAKTVDEDTRDNLTKMAITVLTPHADYLQDFKEEGHDEATVGERISRHRAEELLAEWKKIKVQAMELKPHEESERLLGHDERALKDKLFIITGEDDQDTFWAFKYYGLNTEITEEDKKLYGHPDQ